jgi:hypothetical protein
MRLVTRGDCDGLMCAVLLKAAGIVDEVYQAHPKDMQDGLVEVGPDDIVCNLPYAVGCGMWFDHHASEETVDRFPVEFEGRHGLAPSAARLVYEYFLDDHPELQRFEPLLEVIDRFDSANLTRQDVESPEPAMLLAYIADPRTGLGYHHGYRISNKEMISALPGLLLEHRPEDILEMPDVKERVERYGELNERAFEILGEKSSIEGNVLVTDFRGAREIPPANRFLVYTLPGAERTNISVRLSDLKGGEKVSIQVGHNIFNRTSAVDVGALMAEFGGGGHRAAGTCQVPTERADDVLREIVSRISDG